MTFFPDISTFANIGPISIKWYALCILVGAFITLAVSQRNLVKMGYPKSYAEDLFYGCLISGIIGARLWYIIFYHLGDYLANPISIIMTWQGGLAIQGGLFLGAAYGFYFTRKKKISFLRAADAIVPSILLAQALGRWGNFFNQEAFGRVVNESYYNFFPSFIKNMMLIDGSYREPTFLYESALNVLGFFLIAYVLKKYRENRRGDQVYAYLMWYGITRFFVEGLRTDSLYVWGTQLRIAQLISLAFILVGSIGFLGLLRRFVKAKKPIILFDLDGTLLDTEMLIIESMKRVLKRRDPFVKIDRETGLSFLGPTLSETLARFMPEDEVPAAFEFYRKVNRELHRSLLRPMPGALDLIQDLKAKGYTLGIYSSKKKDMVEYGLVLSHMREYFDVIVGYDEVKQHKPSPEGLFKACELLDVSHDDVIYVGDTDTDMISAHNADMYSIAIVTHQEREEALLSTKPNSAIHSLDEIKEILGKDIAWTHSLT